MLYFLKNIRNVFYKFFLYIKQWQITIIKSAKKESKKKAEEGYQNLCEEEKDKRRKRARERYQNFTAKEKEKTCQYNQERKNKLLNYRRNYYLTHKK